jgi:hypothetical protein
MRDEDDNWFDALAGRSGGEAAATNDAHARAIRAAILSRSAAEEIPVAAEDPTREAALIARARTAGVLLPVAGGRASRRGTGWLAAAAIACVAVGVTLQMNTRSPTPITRGAASGIVRIRAPDPLRLKQELIRELEEAGVHARGYEQLGRQGIDADLPMPVTAEVRNLLGRHGIALPADGVLQVEIESASAP